MISNKDNPPGVRIPGNRQGGTMVPGSPRSGLRAESCVGPQPGGGLPAGTLPGIATAERDNSDEENRLVKNIVTSYLGENEFGVSVASGTLIGGDVADDNMSVSSASGIGRKRSRAALANQEVNCSASDSDIGLRSPKRHGKYLRSRVIESDSDEAGPVVISDSPISIKTARGKRSRIRYRDPNLDLSADLANLIFTDCPGQLVNEELINKDVDDIASTADGWLRDMETVRVKSKKLNGRLSGILKDRINCMKTVIKALVDRVKDSGDVTYLRRRNDELSGQLREAKKEEGRLQSFLKEADAKAEKLSSEIFELRRRIGSMSAESDKPLPPSTIRQPKGRQGTPKASVTPTREKIPRRGSSVVETLQNYDDHLTVINKFDDKIAKFEELLSKMRMDLYGSMETVAGKINQTAAIMDPPKRGVPRIISDIQLVPPRPIPELPREQQEDRELLSDFDSWTEVSNKKSKRRQVRIATKGNYEGPAGIAATPSGIDRERGRPPLSSGEGARRRAPRNAAVSIKANAEGFSYADIIKQARDKVDLKDIGIVNPRMRRAANGGIIIEIAGPDGSSKADTLATRLREVIGDNAVVSRPVVKADLRISGFDDSVIKDEIITSVTERGDCLASDVRVGSFRPMRNGLNMTWVQCPLSAAIKISRLNKLNLGWSVARVELLRAKPIQCFKCWQFGHVRNNCESATDRTGHCFKCGGSNHTSYTCVGDPYCVVCADYGCESAHRLGSSACSAMARGSSGNRGRSQR